MSVCTSVYVYVCACAFYHSFKFMSPQNCKGVWTLIKVVIIITALSDDEYSAQTVPLKSKKKYVCLFLEHMYNLNICELCKIDLIDMFCMFSEAAAVVSIVTAASRLSMLTTLCRMRSNPNLMVTTPPLLSSILSKPPCRTVR
jgi:hypothetical protein